MSSDFIERGIKAYIALGSNIEDRKHYLDQAVDALNGSAGIKVTALSSIYETEPVGYVDQAPFLNMVLALKTTMSAVQLLEVLLKVEKQFGRTRDIKWGPRTLDLDMLLFGKEEWSTPDLVVPHPRMHERAFVLVPFAEVLLAEGEPYFEFIAQQLEKLDGKEGVTIWKKAQ